MAVGRVSASMQIPTSADIALEKERAVLREVKGEGRSDVDVSMCVCRFPAAHSTPVRSLALVYKRRREGGETPAHLRRQARTLALPFKRRPRHQGGNSRSTTRRRTKKRGRTLTHAFKTRRPHARARAAARARLCAVTHIHTHARANSRSRTHRIQQANQHGRQSTRERRGEKGEE